MRYAPDIGLSVGLSKRELALSAGHSIPEMAGKDPWIVPSQWPRAEGAVTDQFAVVTAKTLPPFTTDHDGVSVRLAQGLGGAGDHVHDLGVTQRWSLRLHTSMTEPLDTFLDIASDFQDLVSIAVGYTAQFETVVLHHPELPALSLAGTPFGDMRHDVTYYVRWSNRSASREPIKDHDMYFTFDDLGGIDGVGRWPSPRTFAQNSAGSWRPAIAKA